MKFIQSLYNLLVLSCQHEREGINTHAFSKESFQYSGLAMKTFALHTYTNTDRAVFVE